MSFAKKRIGLLGGSFNPAHAGHVHISLEALKRLKLDEIWWLVSPKNPLKQASDLEDVMVRLDFARALTQHQRGIVVRDDEIRGRIFYSIDSILHLQKRYPHTHFVWLMGADNLKHFHRWKDYRAIAQRIPIAVLDRAPYAPYALASKMALAFKKYRISARSAQLLATATAPAWTYLCIPRHPLSATFLRKSLGKNAFLRHTKIML